MQDMTESFVKMNGLEEPIFNLLYEMLLLYIDFRFYIISFGLRIFCRDGSSSGQTKAKIWPDNWGFIADETSYDYL